MPIDSEIPLAAHGLGQLVNPMELYQHAQQAQLQRQAIQSNQALEEERRQRVADEQRKRAEADRYNALLASSADMQPEDFAKLVQQKAPEHYQAVRAAIDASNEKAAIAKEHASQTALHQQSYIAHLADQIDQSDYDPVVLNMALNHAVTQFLEWKPQADQLRQIAATGGKDALKSAIRPMITSETMHTRAETANAAAELPGKQATSAIQQQVAAGTVGGMTPEQQAQKTARDMTNKIAQQNATTSAGQLAESRRHNLEAESLQDPLSPKRQQALEQQYRGILQKEISSRSGGLGLEDSKVNQAIHLMSIFDQYKNPTTGEYQIPRVVQTELALGLARLTSPNGQVGLGLEQELNQKTARGDIAGALSYITGTPMTGSTQDVFKMYRDSIERQGGVAEKNRAGYFDAMRALAPTDLEPTRREQLEKSLKLNSLTPATAATITPSPAHAAAGAFTVTDPNGMVHTFPSRSAAEAFKRAAGIR